jgi:hypothetical protein
MLFWDGSSEAVPFTVQKPRQAMTAHKQPSMTSFELMYFGLGALTGILAVPLVLALLIYLTADEERS